MKLTRREFGSMTLASLGLALPRTSRGAAASMPAGAIDCHNHVVGPQAKYPMAANRTYTPPEASVAQLKALRVEMGDVERLTKAGFCLRVMRCRAHQQYLAFESIQLGVPAALPFVVCYRKRLAQEGEPCLWLPDLCRGLGQQGQTIRLKHRCSRGAPGR